MTEDKLWPIAIRTVLTALLVLVAIGVDGCSKRMQEFRLECVRNGGTLISHGSGDFCIRGNVERRS
ncbi:hypothetical protein [EBPR siphovirus 2]|nr:hypothetical protein [EBPR siphovirus 2]